MKPSKRDEQSVAPASTCRIKLATPKQVLIAGNQPATIFFFLPVLCQVVTAYLAFASNGKM